MSPRVEEDMNVTADDANALRMQRNRALRRDRRKIVLKLRESSGDVGFVSRELGADEELVEWLRDFHGIGPSALREPATRPAPCERNRAAVADAFAWLRRARARIAAPR